MGFRSYIRHFWGAIFSKLFRLSLPWGFAAGSGSLLAVAASHQPQQQQQQSKTFRPPGNLFLRLIWKSFRPSGPCYFAVSQPPARTSLWGCFEGMGAALWSWFLVGSEGNVRHWGPLPAGAFRPSGPWCCAVSHSLGVCCGAVARKRVPSFRAMLLCCFATAR